MTMPSPWNYSALYNGAYMLPDKVMVMVLGFVLLRTPVGAYMRGKN